MLMLISFWEDKMGQHVLINWSHTPSKQIQKPKSDDHFNGCRKATEEGRTCFHDKNPENLEMQVSHFNVRKVK